MPDDIPRRWDQNQGPSQSIAPTHVLVMCAVCRHWIGNPGFAAFLDEAPAQTIAKPEDGLKQDAKPLPCHTIVTLSFDSDLQHLTYSSPKGTPPTAFVYYRSRRMENTQLCLPSMCQKNVTKCFAEGVANCLAKASSNAPLDASSTPSQDTLQGELWNVPSNVPIFFAQIALRPPQMEVIQS